MNKQAIRRLREQVEAGAGDIEKANEALGRYEPWADSIYGKASK